MNVDEAIEIAASTAETVLATEVERLRAKLSETKRWLDERSDAYGKTCSMVDQLQTELAAAKAAWRDYKADLQKRYPQPSDEVWKFTCIHHQRINDILDTTPPAT